MCELLYGGMYGDAKEYMGQLVGCLCCLLCTGPILMILSIVTLISSFTDTRLDLINEYNLDVDQWNSGPGANDSFKSHNFSIEVSSPWSSQSALLGQVAPEDVHDKPLRSEESFASVVSPYYYKLEPTAAPRLFGSNASTGFGVTYKQALSTPHNLKFKLKQQRGNSTSITDVLSLPNAYLLKSVRMKYCWFLPRSSSGSDSIDCRNPGYDYPGTRFKKKPSCSEWCTSTAKGVWDDTNAGEPCFPSSEHKEAVAGCCRVYFALEKACVAVKSDRTGGYVASSDSGCVHGYHSNVPATYNSLQEAAVITEAAFEKWGTPILQYKFYRPSAAAFRGHFSSGNLLPSVLDDTLPSGGATPFSLENLDVSVRLASDPYIEASRLTQGCTTCTDSHQPWYKSTCTSTQCFGWTPGQKRQLALMFFLFGSLMMIFPCGAIQHIKRKIKKKKEERAKNGGGMQARIHGAIPIAQAAPVVAQAYAIRQTSMPQVAMPHSPMPVTSATHVRTVV